MPKRRCPSPGSLVVLREVAKPTEVGVVLLPAKKGRAAVTWFNRQGHELGVESVACRQVKRFRGRRPPGTVFERELRIAKKNR